MNITVCYDTQWLYPDSSPTSASCELHLARGGHGGVQLLGDDIRANSVVSTSVTWSNSTAPECDIFQLLSVGVDENTSDTTMTTTEYNKCREFVTRQAPFRVYDALRPIDNTPLREARLALYCKISVPSQLAQGRYTAKITISIGGESNDIMLCCVVHKAIVPQLCDSRLSMLNFCCFENIAIQHSLEMCSEAYWQMYRKYIVKLLDLRSTHIMLPAGKPLYNSEGTLTGFDFTFAEAVGKIALECGAPRLCGANIAHWHNWDEQDYYVFWDDKLSTLTVDGYVQLKMYFSAWAQVITRNNWSELMCQSLADEPQTHNDTTYRALAAICRKFLPIAPIIEAVETVNLGGGIDIWVPKQDTFEKNRNAYEKLKSSGEEMWFYTCAFPAGKILNRSMDLPLLGCRDVLWMGFGYGLSGFLHWGLNFYIGEDIWNKACCPHKGELLPAGDAHIVYPDKNQVLSSMRLEQQRNGAEDYELLCQLSQHNHQRALQLQARVCTSFREYITSGKEFAAIHTQLLTELDKLL